MNRASLLHILDHATGITEAEVRELEQLAAAFPYCQTAHLLLAKAAHDRGSMLANQRLRRAATYAADRELLRHLIELPVGAAPGLATPALADAPAAVQPLQAVVEAPSPDTSIVVADKVKDHVTADDLPEVTADGAAQPAAAEAEAAFLPVVAESPAEVLSAAATPEPEVAENTLLESPTTEPAEEPAEELAVTEPVLPEPSAADEMVAPETPETITPATSVADTADELPAVAPPIRPPVEAGSSRFEFGLAEAPVPTPAYQLPGLQEEVAPPAVAVPPFRGDEHLAYVLAAGSRFGYCLTPRDIELTSDLPATAEWYPDAAVQAHIVAHRPAPEPAPSSLALIDRFLRSQPRIKSAAARPAPTDAPQDDLSVRSTSAAPSLASESLAKIMVKQGKIGRAIEIYEQLMQRQPEKKAYFAAQIDLLNQQPE